MLSSDTDLSTYADARRACKLPTPVTVDFADAGGICRTLEGPVTFAAQDPILTGVRGEQWTMARSKFDRAYAPEPGTAHGQPGRYRKRPMVVFALCLQAPTDIALADHAGVLHGEAGDWLVQYGPGDFGIVEREIFAQTYRVVGGGIAGTSA